MTKCLPILKDSDTNRFWSAVNLTANPNKCWNWEGYKDRYGVFWISNKKYSSHRVAYFISNNVDPLEKLVCHSCDNPYCCNPNHLWLGTQKENMGDMISKGRDKKASGSANGTYTHPERIARGSRVGVSKLTEEQIVIIRKLFTTGTPSQKEVAEKFNVSGSLISLIVNKKRWKHL